MFCGNILATKIWIAQVFGIIQIKMTETHVGRYKPYRRFHISNLLKPLIAYLRLLTFSRRFPRNAKYAILSI